MLTMKDGGRVLGKTLHVYMKGVVGGGKGGC